MANTIIPAFNMNHHVHGMLPGTTTIPLLCNICPKKPVFSDTSHLLTHVASKGHLSCYYKMRVKASADPISKSLIDEYDDWYELWHVEDLMMERMNQKERKKSIADANANGHNATNSRRGSGANSVASSRSTPNPTGLMLRRTRAQREGTLDPQLGVKIKVEPKSRSGTPMSAIAPDAAMLARSYAPPMQAWSATPYPEAVSAREDSLQDSLYGTPTDTEEIESLGSATTRSKARKKKDTEGTQEVNEDLLGVDDVLGPDGLLKDMTKLKGVLWDGMGLFDSATPDMRRKRNQKKAINVVDSLQATSNIVEATEQVFDTQGELKRQRPITGNPEEEDGMSPLKGESSPEPDSPVKKKKKGGRKPRQALVEKNVNNGRRTRRRGGAHYPSSSGHGLADQYFDDDDEDDELTYGRSRPQRRGGLRIHRDNSGPEITFEHPASLSSLTSAFRNPLLSVQAPVDNFGSQQSGHRIQSHQRYPSLPPYNPSFGSTNHNPLNLPAPNIGSFGQLSGQVMFHNHQQNHNPFGFPNDQHTFAAFQQQFNFTSQQFGSGVGGFQAAAPAQHHVQNSNGWDYFGFGSPDLGIENAADSSTLHPSNDLISMNHHAFNGDKAGFEDDEATVSPPQSDGH